MIEIKHNFKSKYGDNLKCSLCESHIEDQENMLTCPEIISEVKTSEIKYSDIYGDLDKQVAAIKVWKVVLKVRNRKLRNKL